jgi:hypothetical protein
MGPDGLFMAMMIRHARDCSDQSCTESNGAIP